MGLSNGRFRLPFFGMRLLPELSREWHCVNIERFPPDDFTTGVVQLAMMTTAERHCEFITDLKTDRSRLGKAQMMWIGWLPPTDQARL